MKILTILSILYYYKNKTGITSYKYIYIYKYIRQIFCTNMNESKYKLS